MTTPTPPAELTITDLEALRDLIVVVTKRGTFKASELSSVGMLYDKLKYFIEASQKEELGGSPPPENLK